MSSLDIVLTKNVCLKKKLPYPGLNLTVDITLKNIKDITSDTLSTIFCVTVKKY